MTKTILKSQLNDATIQRLVQIARTHVRLTLEHSQAKTTSERRKAIKEEICSLRIERDALLGQELNRI